eukprot:gene46-67_t
MNLLVVASISIILSLLHVQPYLQAYGLDYRSLLIFCIIWGFSGALISLMLSRQMAKWMMGVKVIRPNTSDPELQKLLHTVQKLARAAYLSRVPEVGIYESYEVNAFATGPSKSRSLVAVSRGLLNTMSQQELEGVIGHEIAHIVNGDMVTMTLVQGVINSFVMFFARILAYIISGFINQNSREKSSRSTYLYPLLITVFELVFMFLGMIILAAYSRFREFRADHGGAQIAGKEAMINALTALKRGMQAADSKASKPAFDVMKISTSQPSAIQKLFATHPPLDERIKRLGLLKKDIARGVGTAWTMSGWCYEGTRLPILFEDGLTTCRAKEPLGDHLLLYIGAAGFKLTSPPTSPIQVFERTGKNGMKIRLVPPQLPNTPYKHMHLEYGGNSYNSVNRTSPEAHT